MPVGLPEVFLGEKIDTVHHDMERGFVHTATDRVLQGIVQVTVVAPSSLFIPILPVTVRGKMMFALCSKCLETERKDWCSHTDKERQITDCWTAAEVH